MPNWVSNNLSIERTPEGIALGGYLGECARQNLSFIRALIPAPEEASKNINVNGDDVGSAFTTMEDDGFDGRQWAIDNYGSKWADCNLERLGQLDFAFDTAWGTTNAGLQTVSARFPNVRFIVYSIEEQPSFQCLNLFVNGEVTQIAEDGTPSIDAQEGLKDVFHDFWPSRYEGTYTREQLV